MHWAENLECEPDVKTTAETIFLMYTSDKQSLETSSSECHQYMTLSLCQRGGVLKFFSSTENYCVAIARPL